MLRACSVKMAKNVFSSRGGARLALPQLFNKRALFDQHQKIARFSTSVRKLQEETNAWVIAEQGAPLKWQPIPLDPLTETQVEVAIKYVGVCHSDVHMQHNEWGISDYPMVTGHEGVGEIVKCGSKVQGLKPGDMVGIGWIRDSCGTCINCMQGRDNNCLNGYQGTFLGCSSGKYGKVDHKLHGCFAEKVRIESKFAFPIPSDMDASRLAPLMCAGTTVWEPIANYVTPGMKVGIRTIGGLGALGIRFAEAVGAEVYALSAEDKEDMSKSMGAHHYIDTRVEDQLASISETLELIIDTSPFCSTEDGVEDMSWLMGTLGEAGSYVRLGLPAADKAGFKFDFLSLTFTQKTIAGSIVCGSKNTANMFKVVKTKNIDLDVEVRSHCTINETFDDLRNGRQTKARFVLEF